MLEYIFFDERPWRSFLEYLQQLQLTPETTVAEECWLVAIPEDIDDRLFERIEAFYDRLFEFDKDKIMDIEVDSDVRAEGIDITLSDGRTLKVATDAELMGRLLSAASSEELAALIDLVVDAVEGSAPQKHCRP